MSAKSIQNIQDPLTAPRFCWHDKDRRTLCRAITLTLLLLLSLPASARIYQCVSNEGNLKFSDFPCADDEQQKLLKGNSQNAARSTSEATTNESAGVEGDNTGQVPPADRVIMTHSELQGSWTDLKEPSPLRSVWTFTHTTLRHRKYTGRTVNARYTLKGNLLTIHHKPGLLHPRPWDEEMEIVQYDGEKLTSTWGATRIVLHRLK